MSQRFILRFELQYYNTYAAFDYKKFLRDEEFRKHFDESADLTTISKEAMMNYDKCKRFLKEMIESLFKQVSIAKP